MIGGKNYAKGFAPPLTKLRNQKSDPSTMFSAQSSPRPVQFPMYSTQPTFSYTIPYLL